MTLVALDLASQTGFAVAKPPYHRTPTALDFAASGHNPANHISGDILIRNERNLSQFLVRYEVWFRKFLEEHQPTGIIYEAPFSNRNQNASILCISLAACLRMLAYRRGIQYVECYTPKTIKKHATGNGNASKSDMVDAATAVGWAPKSFDEADALWLMDYGIAQLPKNFDGGSHDIGTPPALDRRAERYGRVAVV